MKKIRGLACAIAALLCMNTFSAYATNIHIDEDSTVVPVHKVNAAYEELVDNIQYRYGDNYTLNNFSYSITNVEKNQEKLLVDIDIIADMMLTQHPDNNLYLQSMKNAIATVENIDAKSKLNEILDNQISDIENLYYMKPDRTAFLYTVEIDSTEPSGYRLFYRADFENVARVPFEKMYKESLTNAQTQAKVQSDLNQLLESVTAEINATNSVQYDRLQARDYALQHATDTPEFSRANGQGSDCANFVSKCLNDGGFPIDRTGGWYPSSDGTVATCGVNWMRTGYNNNGGVVPYMTGKGYFYHQTVESMVFAGSIMYQTNSSHVMITTYGDTAVIKYAQHSNVKLSSTNAIKEFDVGSCPVPVRYYMPYNSILA